MENTDKEAAALWNKFYMLTTEMYRFLKKSDIDMFFSLLQQRLDLQKMLEKLDNKTYHKTVAGKKLISQINPINVQIKAMAQSWLIRMRNKNNKVNSYDVSPYVLQMNRFNKKM
ncbi:hypothetical protein [Pectinatus sottacetonis]|uniref:hypothetical protein n=1 Tax=Pectinatus sottacetonis TaxID=1002795 RepID=UPI0018C82B9B|nr:hypothetical protein [Pectinatus sottacetonis]